MIGTYITKNQLLKRLNSLPGGYGKEVDEFIKNSNIEVFKIKDKQRATKSSYLYVETPIHELMIIYSLPSEGYLLFEMPTTILIKNKVIQNAFSN